MKNTPLLKRLALLHCLLIFAAFTCDAQRPELVVQTGHTESVTSVAFSPDGRTLASGSRDKTIKLWDVATGTQLRALEGHIYRITSLAFSPDGQTVASSSLDKTIKLWDVATGRQLRSLEGHSEEVSSVAFGPDGKALASGGFDGTLRLWDVVTGTQLHSLEPHANAVKSVTFSPDGMTVASGNGDSTIRLWDVATGTPRGVLKGHTSVVMSVAFSSDGKTLASSGHDKTIKLWDLASGTELRSLTEPVHDGFISIAFSPDGQTLASSSDYSIKLWDVATGTQRRLLEERINLYHAIAFSPDGRTLAGGSDDNTIKLWDIATGTQLHALEGHTSGVSSVAYSPDGKTLASANGGNRIKLWELVTGMQLRSLEEQTGQFMPVAFSPDGKLLASGSRDAAIKLWDITTGTQVRAFDPLPYQISSITFSPDGKTLACGNGDNIWLWEVATGTRLRALEGHGAPPIRSVAFSPAGKLLASGGFDGTVKLWEVATGTQLLLQKGEGSFVESVAFSLDGKTLAGADDHTIKLWNVGTGTQLRVLGGHSGGVTSVAFSPDGRTLASGSRDKTIRLWDVRTGTQLREFEGHTDEVHSVAFSPDGKTLASGGYDAKTKLWNIKSGHELASLISLDETDWLVTTPDGLFDGSPAAWNKMIWRAPQNTFDFVPVEAYFSDYYYPGLLADIYDAKRPQAPAKIEDKDRRQPQVKILSAEPSSRSNNSSWDDKDSRLYMHVTLEVTEVPAGKNHQQGSGARDVRLFRDGTLVKIWRGEVLGAKSSVRLETDVPVLPAENHFTAYAFNHDNIKSSDAALTAKGDQTGRVQGQPLRTAYVLAVGINRYANARFNLKYAVADAQDFGQEWQRQQERLKQFQRVEVVSLLDAEATKANILLAIKQLVDLQPVALPGGAPKQLARLKYAEPQDAVVIYFAGHGTAEGNRFYLLPHDLGYAGNRRKVTEAGLQLLLSHSISDLELEQAFEGLQGGQQVFVIDACNSGQALEAEERRRGPMNSKGLAQLAYEKGMSILTAAQSFQAAQEASQLGHGLLTYALIDEGLKTASADKQPADAQVTLREWLDFATQRVPQMQMEQMRQARGRGLHLSFVEDEEPRLDVEQRNVQRPRVFYRREVESQPLIVARPTARLTPQSVRP